MDSIRVDTDDVPASLGGPEIRIEHTTSGDVITEQEGTICELALPADPAQALETARAFVEAHKDIVKVLNSSLPSHVQSDKAVVEVFHAIKTLLDGLPHLSGFTVRCTWTFAPDMRTPCFPALVAALATCKDFGDAVQALHLATHTPEGGSGGGAGVGAGDELYADPSLLFAHAALPRLQSLEVDVPLSESWVGSLAAGIAARRLPALRELHLRGAAGPCAACYMWATSRPLLQLAHALGGGGAPALRAFTLANADIGGLREARFTAGIGPAGAATGVSTAFGMLVEALATGAPQLGALSFSGCSFGGGSSSGGGGDAVMGALCQWMPRMAALSALSLRGARGVSDDSLQMLSVALALRSSAAGGVPATTVRKALHLLDLGGVSCYDDPSPADRAPLFRSMGEYVVAIKY